MDVVAGMNSEAIPNEMSIQKTQKLESLAPKVHELQAAGKRIVFTNGCFDILHPGHIDLFGRAKLLGDVLIVAVNSDESVRKLKGDQRPVFGEKERVEILAALEMVDFVCIFEEETPLKVIIEIRPDILVKGTDWLKNGIVGQAEVESWGGEVIALELMKGQSTSGIIERVVSRFTKNNLQ